MLSREEQIYELVDALRRAPDRIDLFALPRATLCDLVRYLLVEIERRAPAQEGTPNA